MANDASLMFHGSLAAGTVMTATVATNGATVDLGSNSINRVLLLERRITALTASCTLDTTFADSTDNTTFSAMPGATGALLGFKRATTTILGSTDSIAPGAPDRIVIRTDKRYIRMVTTPGTTFTSATFSVVGRVVDGAYSGQAGAIDT